PRRDVHLPQTCEGRMTESRRHPSLLWSTSVVTLATLAWIVMRIAASREDFFPITSVLPLLICVWTRQRMHLWIMAAAFVGALLFKVVWLLPPDGLQDRQTLLSFYASLLNVGVGAVVVHALLNLRDRQDAAHDRIVKQNSE